MRFAGIMTFIPEDLTGIALVIYGHSHRYEEKYKDGVWYLNPGSCGPRRFRQEITMAVLYIEDDGNIKIVKTVFPCPGKKDSRNIEDKGNLNDEIPTDIALMLPAIMREIDSGKSVEQIARKHHISEELSDQINRMYLTHPGVDVDGILKRLGL